MATQMNVTVEVFCGECQAPRAKGETRPRPKEFWIRWELPDGRWSFTNRWPSMEDACAHAGRQIAAQVKERPVEPCMCGTCKCPTPGRHYVACREGLEPPVNVTAPARDKYEGQPDHAAAGWQP